MLGFCNKTKLLGPTERKGPGGYKNHPPCCEELLVDWPTFFVKMMGFIRVYCLVLFITLRASYTKGELLLSFGAGYYTLCKNTANFWWELPHIKKVKRNNLPWRKEGCVCIEGIDCELCGRCKRVCGRGSEAGGWRGRLCRESGALLQRTVGLSLPGPHQWASCSRRVPTAGATITWLASRYDNKNQATCAKL